MLRSLDGYSYTENENSKMDIEDVCLYSRDNCNISVTPSTNDVATDCKPTPIDTPPASSVSTELPLLEEGFFRIWSHLPLETIVISA